MRYIYDTLGLSSHVLGNGVITDVYLSEDFLNQGMELINQAYELAGDDETLKERILRESIFYRYYLLKFYSNGVANNESSSHR